MLIPPLKNYQGLKSDSQFKGTCSKKSDSLTPDTILSDQINKEVKRENLCVKGKKVMENCDMRYLTGGKMSISAHKRDCIQVQMHTDDLDGTMEVDAGTTVEKHGHIDVQINTQVLDHIQVGLDKTDSEEVMCVDNDERLIRESSGKKDDKIETQMNTKIVFEDTLVNIDDVVSEKTSFERHANIKVEIDTPVDEDKLVSHFICDHCHVMYKSHKCFRIHKKICGELQEKIKLQQAEGSTERKGAKKILCENCPNFFNSVDSFSTHKESHKKDNQSNEFLCDQCPTLCYSMDNLKYHLANMHKANGNIEADSCDSEPFENSKPDETKKKESCRVKYYCDQCEYKASSKSILANHLAVIHEGVRYECDQCDYKGTSKYSLAKHIQAAHEGIKYDCDLCEYRARSKSNLNAHVSTVHKRNELIERSFECKLCEYKANHKSHLSQHTRAVHEGVTYNCKQCDYQTRWKKNLKEHVSSVHEGIGYDCQLCHYKAAKRAHLIRHVLIHKKITYDCDECDFRTKCKQHLADHKDSVHKGIMYSSKNERCPECGKLHQGIKQKIDKKFNCIECSKPFQSNAELQVHMRVHTGEKPFACTFCQKAFNKSCNLQVHTRIHTGETPFKCQECVKGFKELFPLKKHMLKIHGIDYKPLTPSKRNRKKE